ncbi:MAG: hypothetical protein PHV02_03195 [Rhodocyclaceae bacterium]|nr:hypothetical protein [Rhodocyclaceae bacterium]
MLKKAVIRNAGHPWDGRPGFDLLEYQCDSISESEVFVQAAEAKFWLPWLVHGTCEDGTFGGVLYKPSGISAPWTDDPRNPHPGIC